MLKPYGYKTADSSDFWTTYTVQGFVMAESLEEAAKHFGVKHISGYDTVCELTEKEIDDELVKAKYNFERIEWLEAEIELYTKVMKEITTVKAILESRKMKEDV